MGIRLRQGYGATGEAGRNSTAQPQKYLVGEPVEYIKIKKWPLHASAGRSSVCVNSEDCLPGDLARTRE